MADNHARHAEESRKIHEARQADPYRFGARGDMGDVDEAPEILANHGLFSESGGAYDE